MKKEGERKQNTQEYGISVYRVKVRYGYNTNKVLQRTLLFKDKDRKGADHVSFIRDWIAQGKPC